MVHIDHHLESEEAKRISMTERGVASQNMLAEEALKKLENDYQRHMPRQTLSKDEQLLMDS